MVAAHLLKTQGREVFGLHFLTGFEPSPGTGTAAIQELGRQLDVPVDIVDLRSWFKTIVVDYFTAAYRNGETPNPCLVCNPSIKFGVLLEEAFKRGATHLATGHYARVDQTPSGRFRLRKGVDPKKDQSYFLARLTQDQLAHAQFPLGMLTKAQVRAMAQENGLVPATRAESQDVCFIRDGSYAEFLVQTAGIRPQPG